MPTPRRVCLLLEFHLLYKHHTGIFAGVQRYAAEQGWQTVVDDWPEATLERAGKGPPPYDGVIARVDHRKLSLVGAAAKRGVPLVNVMRGSPAYDKLPGVFPDFHQIGRLRAEHLLSRGIRQFAYLMLKRALPNYEQAAGFAAAVEEAGYTWKQFDLPARWGDTLASYRRHFARIHAWMDTWKLPVGLGMETDVFARLFTQMCAERGWRVPGDVAIIAGLNEEKLCDHPRPSLTSIEVGYERIGYEAARLLDHLMDDADRQKKRKQNAKSPTQIKRERAKPVHILLPPVGVVVRESTDFYAVNDDLVARAQAYISDQCHRHLEVNDVAAKLSVSPKTLQNRFAASLNRSVAQEIRRVRIERAKRELTGSDLATEQIATHAGFTSNSRMCEVFRRELGMTPSQYREQRKINKHGQFSSVENFSE